MFDQVTRHMLFFLFGGHIGMYIFEYAQSLGVTIVVRKQTWKQCVTLRNTIQKCIGDFALVIPTMKKGIIFYQQIWKYCVKLRNKSQKCSLCIGCTYIPERNYILPISSLLEIPVKCCNTFMKHYNDLHCLSPRQK